MGKDRKVPMEDRIMAMVYKAEEGDYLPKLFRRLGKMVFTAKADVSQELFEAYTKIDMKFSYKEQVYESEIVDLVRRITKEIDFDKPKP